MFSVWEYVKDEMQARGWNKFMLAMHMGASEMVVNLCLLDFLQAEIKTVPLGRKAAEALGRAFGTSAELWLKIDESYRKQPGTDATGDQS